MAYQQPPLRLSDFATVDITVERMGAGGFGLVFMGPNHANGGAWVALKTLRPELLALHPHLRELFISEGLTWVGLWPHPNLVVCLGALGINERVYLNLAYARHGSLRDLLSRSQPFATRLAWAQHIAAGLLALHTSDSEFLRPHPLVHRDLKPDNVLVQESGLAQITDFGLAAAMGAAMAASPEAERALTLVETLAAQGTQGQSANLTRRATRTTRFRTRVTTETVNGVAGGARGGVGTMAYMPPEQWQNGAEIGPPADLYAFGLILSELLAGRHGLGDVEELRDEDDWYQLHAYGTPRRLQGGPAVGAARLTAQLEALYAALLEKRAEDRPTAAQTLAGLQQAATALGEPSYIPATDYALRANDNRLTFWHNWTRTCLNFARYDEALERSDRALALAPDDFDVWLTRGSILNELGERARQTGDAEKARQWLKEALTAHTRALALASTERERAQANSERAVDLRDLGRYAEAEEASAAALAHHPKDGMTWYNRAANTLVWARAEMFVGRAVEAERILSAGEGYVMEARRCGYDPPQFLHLLTLIQQARGQLGK